MKHLGAFPTWIVARLVFCKEPGHPLCGTKISLADWARMQDEIDRVGDIMLAASASASSLLIVAALVL